MIEVKDQARNKWPSILNALGVPSRHLSGKHGPCPLCPDGGKDRFRFDDKDGTGSFFCNQCGNGDGIDLLRRLKGWTFPETATRVREVLGEAVETRPRPRRAAQQSRDANSRLWSSSAPIHDDDQVAAYLRGRGLPGPYPSALRFCSSAMVTDVPGCATLPAMIALVRDADGNSATLHRTYLQGGRKADIASPRRLMPGELPDGVAVRLAGHDGKLGIAEGIETALHVMRRFKVPCWAALNSANLAKFLPPAGVTELIVFGDNDPKFGGQAAAFACAHKAATKGKVPNVEVRIPDTVGTDWADEQ